MIVVVDHGASTSRWWFYRNDDQIEGAFETRGFNARYASIENRIKTFKEAKEKLPDQEGHIYFYSTGLADADLKDDVKLELQSFFPNMNVEVHTDLTGTGRGLLGDRNGIVAIIGTGSNAGVYENHQISFQPVSLGYILGDEGSGAHIGKMFLKDFLEGRMPEALALEFGKLLPADKNEAVSLIQNQLTGEKIASFGAFANNYKDHAYIQEILEKSFTSFFEHIVFRLPAHHFSSLVASGSIAWLHSRVFEKAAFSYGYSVEKIAKDPMEGLIEYHKSKK